MEPITVHDTEKATVRVYPGKRSEEERTEAIRIAAEKFYFDIQKSRAYRNSTVGGKKGR